MLNQGIIEVPMSKRSIPIHTSDRITFKKCRVAWDFGSILRSGMRPAIAATALGFGTSIHAGAQSYKDPRWGNAPEAVKQAAAILAFRNAWKSMRCDKDGVALSGYEDEYPEMRELGVKMLEHYFIWNKRNHNKIVAVEIPFEIVLFETDDYVVVYRGKIDCIEEDEDGYWIVDYKTVGRWEEEEMVTQFLLRDDQMKSYAWALQKALGLRINGVIYEQWYKGVPEAPARLLAPRHGRLLSVNKNQDTTYEYYLQAIEEVGQSPALYEEILTYLRNGGEKSFFRRISFRRTQAELDYVGNQILMEAREMTRDDVAIYPSPSPWNCKFCDYRAPCEALLRGGDVEFILSTQYNKTEEHYVDYGAVSTN